MSNLFPIVDYEFVSEKFMNILKERRKEKNFTQENIANALNVNIKTYRSWEKGTLPNAIDLFNLANLLECDVDYLLGRMTEENHFKKYIYNHFSLSPETFNKLSLLYIMKNNPKRQDCKASQLSMILEYLINTEDGGYMLDQIRQYVFGTDSGILSQKYMYHSLLHGMERHGTSRDELWIILQDIIKSVKKMQSYFSKLIAQKNAARIFPLPTNEKK